MNKQIRLFCNRTSMHLWIQLLFLLFFTSCSVKEKAPTLPIEEQEIIDNLLTDYATHSGDTSEHFPDTLIMFHGQDGWGQFNIIASLYYSDGRYKTQLEEHFRSGPERHLTYKRSERILEAGEAENLFSKIRDINSSVTDLEPGTLILDFHNYELFIKVKDRTSAFQWQLPRAMELGERSLVHKRKDEVLNIVGQLLKLAGLKPSVKSIYLDEGNSKVDKLKYYIGLEENYYTKSMTIYFDGKPLSIEYGSAELWLDKSDTSNLFNRVKIIEIQYDNNVREL